MDRPATMQRRLVKKPSASNIANASTLASPLAQIGLKSSTGPSNLNILTTPTNTASTSSSMPAIEFNLFRSNSVYSVESTTSLDTVSPEDYGVYHRSRQNEDEDEDEDSPSTPRATNFSNNIFNNPPTNAVAGPSRSTEPSTPTRASSIQPSRETQDETFQLRPVPGRARTASAPTAVPRDAPVPLHPETTELRADWTSIHGEQGSEWGDDEGTFEWLDNESGPEAINGAAPGKIGGLSPGKRLSKLVPALRSGSGTTPNEGVKKFRKQLVFPRRAAPPPPTTSSLPTSSPERKPPSLPRSPPRHEPSIKKAISHPTRIQPIDQDIRSRADSVLRDKTSQSQLRPGPHAHPAKTGSDVFISKGQLPSSTTPSSPQRPAITPVSKAVSGSNLAVPTMVPMKTEDSTSSNRNKAHLSVNSVAYSFYDLDAVDPDSGARIGSTTPTGGEIAFPLGRYTKVSASSLDRDRQIEKDRDRTMSEPSRGGLGMGDGGRTPDDFVAAGIEARGKGDLARSAWYFLKAAEGGSPTGRMYWGLSLRHGWGVARDDQRAFIELRRACDESLSEEGLNLHQSPGTIRLTTAQKKSITKDLSVGLFEIGNCFLDGVGVKKAPEVGVSYLRFAANMGDVASQEQLGHILSKGHAGVKKDMKEAAKWYRMAIAQGSGTFGLAWVWKDKYMT